ncbi:biotin carboxylase N-terminal domain-containing protein [soil metagenome]
MPGPKVLILGHGDATLRIVRACRELGMTTVVLYTDPEINAPYVREADEAYALEDQAETDADAILDRAARSLVDLVHPAASPLAADPAFARRVTEMDLGWVGASEETLYAIHPRDLGWFSDATGVTTVPALEHPVDDVGDVEEFVERHGLPVELVLGSTVRVVERADQIGDTFATFRTRSREPLRVQAHLRDARHLRVYFSRTASGAVHQLGIAEATVARRGTPIIYESPPASIPDSIPDSILESITRSSAQIAVAINLVGAATAEFAITDRAWFLQVIPTIVDGHAAIEEAQGSDVIQHQVLIALRKPVPVPRAAGRFAMQFSICAEDPGRGFMPACGIITTLVLPGGPGVRIDEAEEIGSAIDLSGAVLARVTVSGTSRSMLLERARRALAEVTIIGVASTAEFHRLVLEHPDFEAARVSASWLASGAVTCPPSEEFESNPPDQYVERSPIKVGGRPMVLAIPALYS